MVRGRLTSCPSSAGFRSLLPSALARGVRRFLVPFLLQARRDLLQDVDLEQRRHVRDAPRRQEGLPHRRGRFVRALGRRDREGEGRLGEVVFWFQVKGAHFVVADAHAVDDGFGAQPADFEQVLQGGLVVGVTETVVVRRRRVPLFGDGFRVGAVRCGFWGVFRQCFAAWGREKKRGFQRVMYRSCALPRGRRVESRRLACRRGLVVQWHRRGS